MNVLFVTHAFPRTTGDAAGSFLLQLAKGLGSGIKEFKKATRDVQEDLQRAIDDEPAPPRRPVPPQNTPAQPEPRPTPGPTHD